ncbi:M14 family metallopeptidase [Lacimicrobium alkaliphilum]|uniref:Peptidase M14 n=2 Tax=Lacimicrobium alkaliphilum TaxID=1526571 RepID=A0ABQ1RPT7_9ALTE|nr:M14 family metallopeptidase [Lacimicrobium alkaliphilum]GGD77127.1 peptidase M14 [Lacimicrobium alkaliphilum]
MGRWLQIALMAVVLSGISNVHAQVESDLDYLPDTVSYDQAVPKPESVLGYPVGTWHVRHDQLVSYMRALAQSSPRVSIEEMGRSHEQRPLLLLTFSSKKNQQQIDDIRQQHLQSLEGQNNSDLPLVLWMGYSVHGDEPSGANAALLIAYYLAAAQGPEVDKLLDEAVILMEPALNPDGLSRFAQWANMHKGENMVADANHREHWQHWPSGRTNHYWFDLNRDWLLLTHPESRARLKQYHNWRPHVVTDFHEMGTNSTYFFQPGVPSRKNPWTPDNNVSLTEAMGEYHAKALDDTQQLYFTQEGFDDFYYGKGSTYPDAHGSVGILFEQASSRGHLQESVHGELSFPQTIQNQITTSLSTFAGALANKASLSEHLQSFTDEALQLAKNDDLSGYLLTEARDKSRFKALLEILRQHQIQVKGLSKSIERNGQRFAPEDSVFVPLNQPQYRLIKSIFSTRTSFDDNTFYDVSNWNLPLAFNIEYEEVERGFWRKLPLTDSLPDFDPVLAEPAENAYAYAFSWQDSKAPALLQALLEHDTQVKIASTAFTAITPRGKVSFEPGAVLIPAALKQPEGWRDIVRQHSNQHHIKLWSVTSGLTPQGNDLGSRTMALVKQPKVMMIAGAGSSQYEAGEIWHYFDQRVGLPLTILDMDRLRSVSLSGYSHIIMADGNFSGIADKQVKAIQDWVEQGGVLITQKRAAKWASENDLLKATFMSQKELSSGFDTTKLSYADKDALEAKKRIAGAVFSAEIDPSHPLGFGYSQRALHFLRNSTLAMHVPAAPFVTVSRYTTKPLKAGYASEEMIEHMAGKANIVAHKLGRGKVIGVTDNLSFRGYWYGTSRILSNAIYLSDFIDAEG